jgi:F-box/leucine-rich repeat protein 7
VRVTGVGVEAVVEGCTRLQSFVVSQCKNLQKWLDGGGEERSRRVYGRKGLKFETKKGSGRELSLR